MTETTPGKPSTPPDAPASRAADVHQPPCDCCADVRAARAGHRDGPDAHAAAERGSRDLPWLDQSDAAPVEKARRMLSHLIYPGNVLFHHDGRAPRRHPNGCAVRPRGARCFRGNGSHA